MKTAVLFYSFGGFTRGYAQQLAAERGADLFEIKEQRRRNIFSAFLSGCPQAMKQAAPPIQPIGCDFSAYDTFILAAPIWAGFPAPAFNSALALLPQGAQVELVMTSGGGMHKSRDKVAALVAAQGCQLVSYIDVKAEKKP